jgi:hypothetical protein
MKTRINRLLDNIITVDKGTVLVSWLSLAQRIREIGSYFIAFCLMDNHVI